MIAQHILVPVDFSEPSKYALDYAMTLAGQLHARLTLLHVIQTPIVGDGLDMGGGASLALYLQQLETEMQRTIEEYAAGARQAGLTCATEVVHGVPFQQILHAATEHKIDLIVMGTYGHTGLQHFFLGSVAEKVVRLAPCPVLVTHKRSSGETESEA